MIKNLLVVALALGFALPAAGAGPPPSIDDIDGATFTVRGSGIQYLLNGNSSKSDATIEWTITQTGLDDVSFDTVFTGMSTAAVYVNGFLLSSVSGEFGSLLSVTVSGTPGKLKLKGTYTFFAPPPNPQLLRVWKITGSQIQN